MWARIEVVMLFVVMFLAGADVAAMIMLGLGL